LPYDIPNRNLREFRIKRDSWYVADKIEIIWCNFSSRSGGENQIGALQISIMKSERWFGGSEETKKDSGISKREK
jgi:hypothetical protein